VREGILAKSPMRAAKVARPARPHPVAWTDERVAQCTATANQTTDQAQHPPVTTPVTAEGSICCTRLRVARWPAQRIVRLKAAGYAVKRPLHIGAVLVALTRRFFRRTVSLVHRPVRYFSYTTISAASSATSCVRKVHVDDLPAGRHMKMSPRRVTEATTGPEEMRRCR
jgi:hypothetical protein